LEEESAELDNNRSLNPSKGEKDRSEVQMLTKTKMKRVIEQGITKTCGPQSVYKRRGGGLRRSTLRGKEKASRLRYHRQKDEGTERDEASNARGEDPSV